MGCGASKGANKEPNATEITFKPVGVHSMDHFFTRAKEVLD
jgi:hypothetical protein